MATSVHSRTTSSSALRVAAVSQWTVWAPGMLTAPVTTMLLITRTESAGRTRSVWLPRMAVMAVHSPMSLSSAQRMDALSQWIALDLGISLAPATTMEKITRTRDAESTRFLSNLQTMATAAPILMTTHRAPLKAVLSLWTVPVHGRHMALASTIARITRTGSAGRISSAPLLQTMVMHALTPQDTHLAQPLVALSQWIASVSGTSTLNALMRVL